MRLIDADRLLESLNYFNDETCWVENFINGIKTAISQINWQPTVEAEPIKHAHWIPKRLGDYECSNCHEEYDVCGCLWGDYNYCPGCGAKMNEKEQEK